VAGVIYPKTENLYASNGVNGPEYARGPEFGVKAPGATQIAHWLVTEKVDGMNMRVVVDFSPYPQREPAVQIKGRSDNAQIPKDLLAYMQETFTPLSLTLAFDTGDLGDPEAHLPAEVVLFGEGFGPGIQKAGQAYGGEKRFILFDVVVDGHWLRWSDVEDVASKLGVPTVPVLARDVDLWEALEYVDKSELQEPGSEHIEGIVVRTDPYLFDGRGNRVMFKYKVRDLA
jgi:hypothetical protein